MLDDGRCKAYGERLYERVGVRRGLRVELAVDDQNEQDS